MTFTNHAARELNCKIVYYGPGLGGKTTNLQWLHDHGCGENKGPLVCLPTEVDRTLRYEFMHFEAGASHGLRTRYHLYTVPGQMFEDGSRRRILGGVDGVVFVADSQEPRLEANLEAVRNLHENLSRQGYDPDRLPHALQLNKRDLPGALPVEQLREELGLGDVPVLEAVAIRGTGVFETLTTIVRLVRSELA